VIEFAAQQTDEADGRRGPATAYRWCWGDYGNAKKGSAGLHSLHKCTYWRNDQLAPPLSSSRPPHRRKVGAERLLVVLGIYPSPELRGLRGRAVRGARSTRASKRGTCIGALIFCGAGWIAIAAPM